MSCSFMIFCLFSIGQVSVSLFLFVMAFLFLLEGLYLGNKCSNILSVACSVYLCMKGKVKVNSLSRVRLFATPWTVAHQAPLSMGFSRQEYCSGLPFPSPGDLPNPGIEPGSSALQADALPSEPPGKPTLF